MLKNNPAEFLLETLQDKVPENLRPFINEARETGKRFVSQRLGDFDLVSRDEFEAQQALLQQALAKIDELERRLKARED